MGRRLKVKVVKGAPQTLEASLRAAQAGVLEVPESAIFLTVGGGRVEVATDGKK
jgi:hypothetical protein